MAAVELRTLGDCQILIGESRLGPQSPHAFAVALYLCIERGRPHSRDELQALFFPGAAEANAAHSLRQAVYKLRMLGLPCTTEAAGTLVATCDVRDDYSSLLATGQLPAAAASPLPGTFLPGYWPRISDDFTRWLEAHRDAVNGALRRAYVARVVDRHAVARWDQVELYARACLQIDPLNEEATLGLAEALALNGSKVAGLKVLERYIDEVGGTDERLRIPAVVLRKRISERLAVNPARATEPPLVGREAELRLLAATLAEARTGAGRAVHVSGEPGIGKTRLLREFLTSALLNGAQAIEVGAQPHDLRRPFSTISELASQLLRTTGALGAAPASISILRRLVTVDPGDAEITTPLVASPAEMESRLAAALADLVDAITQERSLIVAVEDVHWSDSASRRVIDAILADRRPRRLLWILTSRGVQGDTLGRATAVPLRGLDREEGGTFVSRYLATRLANPPANLADKILNLGGGNPFYLRSLCDYYADSGDYDSTPPQLRDIVLQRVRGLDTRARTILSMCAVLGRCATMERLEATLGMPCHELAAALADLEVEGLLRLREGILLLQHDLLSAAVLDETPDLARSVMRRAVARRLEAEGEASGELSLLWQAADHWTACGEPGKAKELFKACALHAAKMGSAGECLNALLRHASVASSEEAAELTAAACSIIRLEVTEPFSVIRRWLQQTGAPASSEIAPAFELAVLEGGRYFRADSELHLDYLLSLMQDNRLAIDLRHAAASLAMSVADDNCDPTLAAAIADHLNLAVAGIVEDDDATYVRMLLMYHICFGDVEKAIELARSILSWRIPTPPSTDHFRSTVNAGIALMSAGCVRLAFDAFQRAVEMDIDMPHKGILLAHGAAAARQAGMGDEEAQWQQRLQTLADARPLSALNSSAIYYLARRALDRGDRNGARALSDVLTARLETPSHNAHWAMLTALRLRIGVVDPKTNPETIETIAEWSLRAAPRVPEDDVALALCIAYQDISVSGAQDYARRYMQLRNVRVPVLPILTELTSELLGNCD